MVIATKNHAVGFQLAALLARRDWLNLCAISGDWMDNQSLERFRFAGYEVGSFRGAMARAVGHEYSPLANAVVEVHVLGDEIQVWQEDFDPICALLAALGVEFSYSNPDHHGTRALTFLTNESEPSNDQQTTS